MKAKKIVLFISLALGITNFSCTDFDKLNEDPNRVKESDYNFSEADLDAVLRYGSNLDYINNDGGLAGGGDLFDRIKNNCWEPWAQYFVGGANPNNGWMEAYWKANYTTWMALLNGVIRDAEELKDRDNTEAVARIWRVYMLSTFSDFFGPVPFSIDPKEPNPDYMSVQDLHNVFFSELDRAVKLFNQEELSEKYDFIFNGDKVKWKKFANTLRFMLALKLSEIDPSLAKTQMLAALKNEGGLISDEGDDVLGRWYDSWANGPAYGQLSWNHYVMTSTMEKMITGIGGMEYTGEAIGTHPSHVDPRGQIWFDPSSDGKHFVGMNVAPTNGGDSKISWISAYVKAENRRPLDQLTYIETCFLLAEAVERGFVSSADAGGDAKTWYENGVKASFKRWKMNDKVDTYLSSTMKNRWGTSAKYDDDTSAAGNTNLEKIVTQRYLGLFTDLSFHVWNDKRRLNLPAMDIPEVQNNGIGSWPKDGNIKNPANYFQRGLYPQSEAMNNTEKYNGGLTKLGGENKVTTPLWWASKRSNYCTSTN